MRKPLTWLALTLALAANAAAAPPAAGGKSPARSAPRAAKPAPKPAVDQERLKKSLESGDEAEMRAALAELTALGPDGAVAAPLVDALLGRGANVAVLVDALRTAGALGVEGSSAAVAPYVQHRKPEIRLAAAETLAKTKGGVAVAGLRRALGSSDPALRAAAARGLGGLGASEAVGELFRVLSHDTPDAALAIALLCAPPDCDRLMSFVGKLKYDTLEPAFVPLLTRPANALPDAHKIKYVDRLRRLATESATAVLTIAQSRLPEDASPELRAAFQAALRGRPITKDDKQ